MAIIDVSGCWELEIHCLESRLVLEANATMALNDLLHVSRSKRKNEDRPFPSVASLCHSKTSRKN